MVMESEKGNERENERAQEREEGGEREVRDWEDKWGEHVCHYV